MKYRLHQGGSEKTRLCDYRGRSQLDMERPISSTDFAITRYLVDCLIAGGTVLSGMSDETERICVRLSNAAFTVPAITLSPSLYRGVLQEDAVT